MPDEHVLNKTGPHDPETEREIHSFHNRMVAEFGHRYIIKTRAYSTGNLTVYAVKRDND